MVELVDVADTLTSLCGLPAMTTTDGYDLSELLSGANQPVRQMAVTENPWSKSIRFGDWRYIYYPSQMFDGQDVGELYHIANDPDETMNLYADPEYQSVVREAKDRLLEWVITTSRVRSVWPRLGKTPEGQSVYESSTDGLENKYAGPKQRLLAGHYNYV
jgi:arylsulfatase A-like enzyme